MHRLLTVLFVSVGLALVGGSAAADDGVNKWTRKIGYPATPKAIEAALDEAAGTEDGERLLARALGTARGPAAVKALRSLLRDFDRSVRVEALASLVRVGLRSSSVSAALYSSLRATSRNAAERRAAVLALGTVGDGSDMDTLLVLASPDERDTGVRDSAFRAMTVLTGKKLPYVHSRWTYWWRGQKTDGLRRLEKALASTQKASGSTAVGTHLHLVRNLGWIDTTLTSKWLKAWLRGARLDLQIAACGAAADLRLVDLVVEIQKHASGRGKQALRSAAKQALERLGVTAGGPSR